MKSNPALYKKIYHGQKFPKLGEIHTFTGKEGQEKKEKS